MNICNVHCLFEQSGTFKREFEKLGVCASDYDILNDFGETDHVCDLFAEIDRAYEGKASIFDNCKPEANLVFEPLEDTPVCNIARASKAAIDASNTKVKRSMIHPQYARRFILRYIGPQPHQ